VITGFLTTVPELTPVTIPDEEPTVAQLVLLLLHVPPPVTSLSDVVELAQTTRPPVIAAGVGFTVKDCKAKQPVGIV
jgi:hypothetical protein